ncbi:hypothetical protein [Gracilinema caldarium]|uniref:TP0183 family DNA metabolism protein n=1 Tax=Gracilinema caldarium TaxID=215591 RepID=UPI0026F11273|nr:hypothetical protein [Gracilinema caldarium]
MTKRNAALWVLFFNISLSIFAQKTLPVLAILPFTAPSELAHEGQQIEKLVQSYTTQLGLFRLVAPSDRDKILSEWEFSLNISASQKIGDLLSADFLLQGNLGTLGSNYLLTLEVIKVKTGEKISFSSIEPDIDSLSANLKSLLLKTYMQQADTTKANSVSVQKAITRESDIIGTWQGDKGIEIVRLFPGGYGQAIFTSGAKMELRYKIENGSLIVVQTSPNIDRYYHPLPYKIASQMVKQAQPMRWIFSEYNNTSLIGKKMSTGVRYDGEKIIEIIHDTERTAEWVRTAN